MSSGKEAAHELPHALARLMVATCLGRWDEVERLRRDRTGEPDRGWRETLLQAHLFAGFPRVVEAFRRLDAAGGLGRATPAELEPREEDAERGREIFARVYGEHAPRVRARLARSHPSLADWIEGHAYGRVLARGGLSLAQREVLAVVALAALDQERQLTAHARGALAVGVRPEHLRESLDSVRDLLAPAAHECARRVLETAVGPGRV